MKSVKEIVRIESVEVEVQLDSGQLRVEKPQNSAANLDSNNQRADTSIGS